MLLLTSCDPFQTKLHEHDVHYYTASEPTSEAHQDTLLIMNWNIKFGGGRIDFFFDCFGDRAVMTKEEVLENLKGVAWFINQVRPDILFVQEIDINSKRAAFIDQVQWLLDHTHFNHAVYTPQWRATHIPSNGLGRMNSGQAILSRWPLENARRIALPLIEEQNSLVRYFYLRRGILECTIQLNNSKMVLLNTHTEPYAPDGTKKKQLKLIMDHIKKIDEAGEVFILAGDLNTLPPGSKKTSDFPDSVCPPGEYEADDYSQETLWLTPLYDNFIPAVALEDYQANNQIYFTHTVDGNGFWNRKLDYLFTNGNFIRGSDITYQSPENGGYLTMPLSDHCAVSVEFQIE